MGIGESSLAASPMRMRTDLGMAEQLLGGRKGRCCSLGTQCVRSPSYGNRKPVVVEAVGFYWTEVCVDAKSGRDG